MPTIEKKKKKKKRKSCEEKEPQGLLANPLRKMKRPSLPEDASYASAFYNPFQDEQDAKTAVLEKHIKMTCNTKDVNEINGKKICWNYRKGRCKFGHNCKYAHDSDLLNNPNSVSSSNTEKNDVTSAMYNIQSTVLESSANIESDSFRKRKPGLAKGLIPNKRSRKMFKDIQLKETPWKK